MIQIQHQGAAGSGFNSNDYRRMAAGFDKKDLK
jgi:hypothetical protein